MFTIATDPTFTEDVAVRTPGPEGWITQKLRTTFRLLPQSEIEALYASGDVVAVAERLVVEFSDLVDDDDKPLDGKGVWRGKLLDFETVRLALVTGYKIAVVRVGLGNFGSSAAAGPPAG